MAGLRCLVADLRIGIRIEQPERDVNTLDLIDVILIGKDLRKQLLAAVVLFECIDRRFFVKLERDDIIGLERTCELSHHDNGIAAVRAGGRTGRFLADDHAAAGFADVFQESLGFAFRPFIARLRFPFHTVSRLAFQYIVVGGKRFHFKFRVAVRADHLLRGTVKSNRTAAARTLIFL